MENAISSAKNEDTKSLISHGKGKPSEPENFQRYKHLEFKVIPVCRAAASKKERSINCFNCPRYLKIIILHGFVNNF
jgi:hypothetical protein